MTLVSIGDMARAFRMQGHNAQLKAALGRLTQEVTTGVQADRGRAVAGDFTALAGIDCSLRLLDAFATATTEAELVARSVQTALGTLQDLAGGFGATLLGISPSSSATMTDAATADARQRFDAAVSALNLKVAERYALSGEATDTRPLADPGTILAALTAAIAGQATGEGVATAVDAWFDAPAGGGGFLDIAYLGAGTPAAAARIGAGPAAEMSLTAADPALRGLLKGLALAALASEGALAGQPAERGALARAAGAWITGAGQDLAGLRAGIGATEARLADAATRNAAEASALRIARAGLVAADPYDSATALEAARTQIETLYTLTARLSRLSLAEYLR